MLGFKQHSARPAFTTRTFGEVLRLDGAIANYVQTHGRLPEIAQPAQTRRRSSRGTSKADSAGSANAA